LLVACGGILELLTSSNKFNCDEWMTDPKTSSWFQSKNIENDLTPKTVKIDKFLLKRK
jgi:hypothetical protein